MTPVSKRSVEAWILVADTRCGRLLRGSPAGAHRVRLAEVERRDFVFPESERGRPGPLGAKDGHAWTSPGHEDEEKVTAWARELVEFVKAQRGVHRWELLTIFAPPRLVGALRQAWPDHALGPINAKVLDLGGWSLDRLAKHAEVIEALGS